MRYSHVITLMRQVTVLTCW